MNDQNLVPTRVVTASGVSTTVYRKPPTPAVAGRASKPRTTKALIIDACISLGISKAMSTRIAKKSGDLTSEVQAALLNLVEQPDPYGTVKNLLIDKYGQKHAQLRPDGFDPYKDPHANDGFEAWVINANHHLHTVNELIRRVTASDEETDSGIELVISGYTDRYADLIISGLRLHAENEYTTEQMRDIALVTAAASSQHSKDRTREYDLTKLEVLTPKDHNYLCSKLVLERITSNHEVAMEAVRLILEENVLTEAEMLHRLDGTPRSLVIGVI